MRKKLFAGVAVLIVILIAGAVYMWHRSDEASSTRLVLHGNVDIRQVSLAFEGNGRVAEVKVEEGQHVKAGAVLAVLDTRTLQLQLDEARAQSEALRQALLRLHHGSRPEEISSARSRVAAAQADADRAGRDVARLQGVAASTNGRGVSPEDLDRAGSALQVAHAKLAEQRDTLRLAELGPRTEDVAGADAQHAAAQAQIALLQHQIDLGELKAPADAVVRSRLLEPGDMATPQRPVFALAMTQPKWVRVYVNEPDLGRVKPGMPARVWTDSHPDQPLHGTVGFISSSAEFTPKSVQTEELRTSLVYEVRVLVDDPGDAMRLGQPASVQLDIGAMK
jgi:HlyD family secretion protein